MIRRVRLAILRWCLRQHNPVAVDDYGLACPVCEPLEPWPCREVLRLGDRYAMIKHPGQHSKIKYPGRRR